MAPLPKKRHSKARQGKRRAAISYSLPKLIECTNCQKMKLPHQVCPHCGFYRKQISTPLTSPKVKVNKVS